MMTSRPRILFEAGDLEEAPSLLEELRRFDADVVARITAAAIIDPGDAPPPDLAILGGALGEGRVGSLTLLIRGRWPRLPLVLVSPEIREPMRPTATCRIIPPERRQLREAIEELLPGLAESPSSNRRTVLCVDDDVRHLRALTRLISNHGYRVAAFEDPAQALRHLPETAPDVAILDLKMPGMDGWSLTREIASRYRESVPVILLTALADDEDVARGYHEGASYYLTKPFEPRRVLNILDYLVGDLDAGKRAELETQL